MTNWIPVHINAAREDFVVVVLLVATAKQGAGRFFEIHGAASIGDYLGKFVQLSTACNKVVVVFLDSRPQTYLVVVAAVKRLLNHAL